MREMRGDEGNHHEKLGLKRILSASQCTIPDTAGMSPDLACNYTDTRSTQPNQASCTQQFSYPCNGVVNRAWLGLPDGHVRCPVPGNRQPYIDIAMET